MRWTLGLMVLAATTFARAETIVLYEDRVVEVADTLADPTDLWIRPADLPRVNGFELKPEGACIDDICVPVRQSENSDIFLSRSDGAWFNVAELADRLEQPYVVDHDAAVWSFGAIPVRRAGFREQAVAPDFTLPDLEGTPHRLSDYRGRKVLLLTWASW